MREFQVVAGFDARPWTTTILFGETQHRQHTHFEAEDRVYELADMGWRGSITARARKFLHTFPVTGNQFGAAVKEPLQRGQANAHHKVQKGKNVEDDGGRCGKALILEQRDQDQKPQKRKAPHEMEVAFWLEYSPAKVEQ